VVGCESRIRFSQEGAALRASLQEEARVGPRYRLLQCPGVISLGTSEKAQLLEALRYAPFPTYGMLASFEGTQPELKGYCPERYNALKRDLATYPLSIPDATTLLRAIVESHFVITVACGRDADRLRCVLRPWLPSGILPAGEFLLLNYGHWDGLSFDVAVDRMQQPGYDSSYEVALAIVESAHGRPWNEDPRKRWRFSTFPPAYRDALWASARRQAGSAAAAEKLVRQALATAFVDVVGELPRSPIRRRRPRGWGADFPPEAWPRVNRQSAVRHKVQARVRDEFVRKDYAGQCDPDGMTPCDTADATPRRRYVRRGSRTCREAWRRLNALPLDHQRRIVQGLRERLSPPDYSLCEYWLGGGKVAVWARDHGIKAFTARQRLVRVVRPALERAIDRQP
jgi:hypothetical protein